MARTLATTASVAGLALGSAPLAGPAEAKSAHAPGTRSLATVLAADGSGFDGNWSDYDIVENAARAVIGADTDKNSPVRLLTKGDVPLTAFIPTDRAFRKLANEVFGYERRSEAQVFQAVASLGLDTVETVLSYHVVGGATIDYRTALRSDGAELTTAAAGADPLVVDVKRHWWCRYVTLVDADTNDRNPVVVQPNINKGNVQIAQGINRVLRPLDLP
jgi:hypothetical protein